LSSIEGGVESGFRWWWIKYALQHLCGGRWAPARYNWSVGDIVKTMQVV